MFKDQKIDWTHTGINLKHNKSNLQSDGPSSLFSLEGWSAEYCTSPQKKKHLMMIAGYNKKVKDIQLIW